MRGLEDLEKTWHLAKHNNSLEGDKERVLHSSHSPREWGTFCCGRLTIKARDALEVGALFTTEGLTGATTLAAGTERP